MPGSNNDWEQYYQKSFTPTLPMNTGGVFSSVDETIVTTSTSTSPTAKYDQSFVGGATSPTVASNNGSGSQLTPTGSVSKPIRRRSRVSKKTPITLLSANATNFRALVQQFTGCSAANSKGGGSVYFGSQKGPINLSFGSTGGGTNNNSSAVPFGNQSYGTYNYNHQQQRLPLLQLQENNQVHVRHGQDQDQDQLLQRYPTTSFDNNNNNNNNNASDYHVFHYSSNSSSASPGYNQNPLTEEGMEFGDGFDQEDISLHELLD